MSSKTRRFKFPQPVKSVIVAKQRVKVVMNKFWFISPFDLSDRQKLLRAEAMKSAQARVDELSDDGFIVELNDSFEDYIVVYRSDKRVVELVAEIEAKRKAKQKGKKKGRRFKFTLTELREDEAIVRRKYDALIKRIEAVKSISR